MSTATTTMFYRRLLADAKIVSPDAADLDRIAAEMADRAERETERMVKAEAAP